MNNGLHMKTVRIVLLYITWVEFVAGFPCTDFLGMDDPETHNEKDLLKFAKLLETKSLDDIKGEDMWDNDEDDEEDNDNV
jgi:hypothetical protein